MMGAVIVSYGGHALGAASCKKLLAKNWTLSFDLRAQAREVLTKTNFGQKKAFDNGADILPMVASNQGTEENLDDLWDVKVRAPFRIIKAVPPHLKAKGKKRMVKIGFTYGKRFQKNLYLLRHDQTTSPCTDKSFADGGMVRQPTCDSTVPSRH